MSGSLDDKTVRKYLAAFADGELEVEQTLKVLEHMAMNPEATRRVMHQQQLRQAVQRAVVDAAPDVTPELRAAVARIAEEAPAASAEPSETPRATPARPTALRWIPAAAAALLLVASVAVFLAAREEAAAPGGTAVPASLAKRLQMRHEECSAQIQRLQGQSDFPADLVELPAAVVHHVGGGAIASLDLTALGYAFEAAGKCSVPGKPAVHMIYRALPETGRDDALSLWIKAYEQVPDIRENRLYFGTDADAPQTILLWRRGHVIYYLVGDTSAPMDRVANALLGT